MKRVNLKINTFMIVLSTILFNTSCGDILDTPLENVQIANDIDYTKSEDMDLLINGAYNELYDFQWEMTPIIAVRGDDVELAGFGDQPVLAQVDSFRYDRNFWMFNSVWLNFYTNILHWEGAKEEITKYQQAGANAEKASQYIAEVKVMQAFSFLTLAKMWNKILIPVSSNPHDLNNVQLSDFEQVMKHVSVMMDEASVHIPKVRPNQRQDIKGGVTYYTALAIKALANLEIKNYTEVADCTGQIIESGLFSLDNDYYQLFKIPGKLNSENLLEFQYSDFGNTTGAYSSLEWGFFGPGNWTPARQGIGPGWGFWQPSIKYIKFMLDRGETERLETTVLFTPKGIETLKQDPKYSILPEFVKNTTREGDMFNNHPRHIFSSGKHYLPSNQIKVGRNEYGGLNKNLIVLRYAEILLMHAEALTSGASRSGMTATEAVNLVRSRAKLEPLASVTIDNVLDEKYAELAMEWGSRFHDMNRHDRLSELNNGGRLYDVSKRFYPYPLEQQNILKQLQ